MPLAQDQRAMLQLLLERGQSYEDIASLLGGSRDDVRRRARAALEELGGQDPDREIGLTDYMLGQADPIGRADAVRHLQADPHSLALAEELSTKLRLIAPEASLPDLPVPKRRRRAAVPGVGDGEPAEADATAAGERRSPLAGISTRQSRLFAAVGASALILLFVVLAIAGVFGGGDEASTPEATTATNEEGSTVTDEIARIVMQPQGDFAARGEAVVGLANETQPFVDLDIQNLPEISNSEAFIFWFLLSRDSGFPLPGALPVSADGAIQDRLAIPAETLGVVAQSRFLAVSVVDRQELSTDIDQAIRDQAGELDFSGETVLLGQIPLEAEGTEGGQGISPEDAVPPAEGAGSLPEAGSPGGGGTP